MSSDRFRLGYAYRISWGGNNLFPTSSPVPGLKMQLRYGDLVAYVGTKATLILNQEINEMETNYAGLGGVSYDVMKGLKLEANGGFFQRGVSPKQEVLGAPVQTFGGSAQVSYSSGIPVGTSIDFTLYANDPSAPQQFFKPEVYPGGFSWMVSSQGTLVGSTLENPDRLHAGSTVLQKAYAGDVQFRAKSDYLRFFATGMARDINFITLNVPSIPPYVAPDPSLAMQPEFFFDAGVDYNIPSLHFTPGVIVGVMVPASMTSGNLGDLTGTNPPSSLTGKRTVVVRQDPAYPDRVLLDVLPNNCGSTKDQPCSASLIYGAKLTGKIDVGDNFAVAGELFFNYNPNRATTRDDYTGVATVVFDSPWDVGFTLMGSARF
jgi:hypothetical protein